MVSWVVKLLAGKYTPPVRPAQRVHARLVHRLDGPAASSPPPRLPTSATACAARDPGALDRHGPIELHDRRERRPAQKVDTVKPGPYTIGVRDQSNEHNFRLQGSGVSKTTTVGFVGTQKWSVTLAPGTYRYQCDPHATMMKGP